MADVYEWEEPEVRRVADAVRKIEGLTSPQPRDGSRPPQSIYRPPIYVMLMEDLVSGGTARAAGLAAEETNEVQIVTLRGTVTGGTFRVWLPLSDTEEYTAAIPFDATAEEFRAALEAQTGAGTVEVTLGELTVDGSVYRPGRWTVEFTGSLAGTDVPLLVVDYGDLDGTEAWADVLAGEQWVQVPGWYETVRNGIPVGSPTPLLAGSIARCSHIPGWGYDVDKCESRQFETLEYA